MIKDNSPLVSIVVITYNSSNFVLETLESAKIQTYKNKELIVTDDCSADNTVEICEGWIKENSKWFKRAELVKSVVNTGIPANCNRGIKSSDGEWIKLIAGDDALKGDSIESLIDFLSLESQTRIDAVHSKMDVYRDSFSESNFIITTNPAKYLFSDIKIKAIDQYLLLLRDVFYISAPSTFYRADLLKRLNGFDESMPYEDWPIYLSLTKGNNKIFLLDKVTVNYRIHSVSIHTIKKDLLFNDFFVKDRVVYTEYRRSYLTFMERVNEDIFYLFKKTLFKIGLNKKTIFSVFIFQVVEYIYLKTKRIYRFLLERKIINNLKN